MSEIRDKLVITNPKQFADAMRQHELPVVIEPTKENRWLILQLRLLMWLGKKLGIKNFQ